VRPELAEDSKRHRFFSPEQVRSLGDQGFHRVLARSFGRRLLYTFDRYPKTIDDVRQLKQQSHLNTLKSKADASSSHEEMVRLLSELNADLEARNAEQEKQLCSAQETIGFLELAQEDGELRIATAEYHARSAREQGAADTKLVVHLQRELTAFRSLSHLRRSIKDCGEFFRDAFSSKLGFTERGRASLDRESFSNIDQFWEALWAMGTELHRLFFDSDDRGGDIEKKFKERTGVDMSMTEGSQTKADKKLMKKREDSYEGEAIDITPHIKLRSGNEHFRIYFGVMRSKKLLVIGECTNHLETAGTRRRGQ
jgi:hypothetical protein